MTDERSQSPSGQSSNTEDAYPTAIQTEHGPHDRGRPRPRLFCALGRADPPERIDIGGDSFERIELLKHDSWAASAVYGGPKGKVVVKFNRQEPSTYTCATACAAG